MSGGTVCRLRPKARPASTNDIAIGSRWDCQSATQLLVTFLERFSLDLDVLAVWCIDWHVVAHKHHGYVVVVPFNSALGIQICMVIPTAVSFLQSRPRTASPLSMMIASKQHYSTLRIPSHDPSRPPILPSK
jgi:hypothetical protein